MVNLDIEIRISPDEMDIDWLHDRLSTDTYWAKGRSRDRVERLVAASRCYGAFVDGAQVGFARVVTDTVTFAWLSDVYVDRSVRGQGISKRLVARVIDDCKGMGLRRILLATDDAAGLYSRFGFDSVKSDAFEWMALTWQDHEA